VDEIVANPQFPESCPLGHARRSAGPTG
jgi:hypothetical protein